MNSRQTNSRMIAPTAADTNVRQKPNDRDLQHLGELAADEARRKCRSGYW